MRKVIAIIPARYDSTRLRGKVLKDINGMSMIRRVWEQVKKSNVDQIYVATNDERIINHVTGFCPVILTQIDYKTGTDRCAGALQKLRRTQPEISNHDIVINVQADQPFLHPGSLNLLIELMRIYDDIRVGTLLNSFTPNFDILSNPSVVKVVRTVNGNALYFSRSVIPYNNNPTDFKLYPDMARAFYFIHIGVYGFRVSTLEEISQIPHGMSLLENMENLEQLRWMEHDIPIYTFITEHSCPSVDTPEDLENAIKYLK